MPCSSRRWSGGVKLLGKLSVPEHPPFFGILENSRARTYWACSKCVGCLDIFSLVSLISFISPFLGDGSI